MLGDDDDDGVGDGSGVVVRVVLIETMSADLCRPSCIGRKDTKALSVHIRAMAMLTVRFVIQRL